MVKIAMAGVVGLCLLACTKEKKDEPPVELPTEGPIDGETLQALFPKVACEKVIECGCSREDPRRSYCEESLSQYIALELEAGLDGLTFDGQAAWECLIAARDASCDDAEWTRICSRVTLPALEVGAECLIDRQCLGHLEGETYCAGSPEGTCEAGPPLAGEGERCAATLELDGSVAEIGEPQGEALCPASDGLYCGHGAVCRAAKDDGEACESNHECSLGSHCTAELVCAPPANLGDECQKYHERECGGGNYCSDEGLCVEKKPLGSECAIWRDVACAEGRCSLLGECVPPNQLTVCEHFSFIEIGVPDPGEP